MSDVFREVDEAVREDQIKRFMNRYGVLVGIALVVIVVGIGGWQFWKSWHHDQQVEASDAYAAAMLAARTGKTTEALDALGKLSDPAGGEVGTLAALAQARILMGEGQRDEAIKLWDAVAASDASGPVYQDVALLLSVMHQVGRAPSQALSDRLAPLAAAGEPFRPLAQELQALLALDSGDSASARVLLEGLRDDPETTAEQKERVTQLLAMLPG